MLSREDDHEIESAVAFLVSEVGLHNKKSKPVILHSLRVGIYLYGLGYAKVPVMAGVLHDVIESTAATAEQVEAEFGTEVALLVKANSHDQSIPDMPEQYKDTFRRCLEAGEDALAIKAADQMDNLAASGQEDDAEKQQLHLEKAAYLLDLSSSVLSGKRVWQDLKRAYEAARPGNAERGQITEPDAGGSAEQMESRNLLLLRHGKAKPDSPQGDKARELSRRGRNDSVTVGRMIASLAGQVDLVVSSDAIRALETAHLAAAAAGYTGPINTEPGIYAADTPELLEIVQGLPDSARTVLLVGHNPGLEYLADMLGEDGSEGVAMPTAGLVHLRLRVDQWAGVRAGMGELAGVYCPKDE